MNKKLFLHNPMVIPWVIIIIAWIVFIYSNYSKFSKTKEKFTPGFRAMYNPHIRNMRVYTTKTYNNVWNKAKVLLSKFGII